MAINRINRLFIYFVAILASNHYTLFLTGGVMWHMHE